MQFSEKQGPRFEFNLISTKYLLLLCLLNWPGVELLPISDFSLGKQEKTGFSLFSLSPELSNLVFSFIFGDKCKCLFSC